MTPPLAPSHNKKEGTHYGYERNSSNNNRPDDRDRVYRDEIISRIEALFQFTITKDQAGNVLTNFVLQKIMQAANVEDVIDEAERWEIAQEERDYKFIADKVAELNDWNED